MIADLTSWERIPANPNDYVSGLIEMPDGQWIDPALITRVAPLDAVGPSRFTKHDAMARCVVDMGENNLTVLECADFEGAKDCARWFAGLANRARGARMEPTAKILEPIALASK